VEIKGDAADREYGFSYYMPKTSSSNILTDDRLSFSQYNSVAEILRNFPNLDVVTDESGKSKAIIRRMSYRINSGAAYNYAALIIDDIIIYDYDLYSEIEPSNIERIGVLAGAQATILGSEGAGGAVVISTKKVYLANYFPKFNVKTAMPLGYQVPAEFYSQRYETTQQLYSKDPDLRTTIYWNPDIRLNSSGDASFDFYTADAPTTYTMTVEGITSEGSIIHIVKRISRK